MEELLAKAFVTIFAWALFALMVCLVIFMLGKYEIVRRILNVTIYVTVGMGIIILLAGLVTVTANIWGL